ncbi:MAG: hypothetical protein KDD22_02335 [Bdellovibrionales bacterium]|nr:hypothetical protein [Bdellovibrionales bacterium]
MVLLLTITLTMVCGSSAFADKKSDSGDILSQFAGSPIESYPGLILIEESEYFRLFWDFRSCKYDKKCQTNVLTYQRQRQLMVAQSMISRITVQKLREIDEWGKAKLPFWKKTRSSIFPVHIALNPFAMAPEGTGVYLGSRPPEYGFNEYQDSGGSGGYKDFSGTTKYIGRVPIITSGVFFNKEHSIDYSQMIVHEFGHALLYSLGIPQYLSPWDETFADMLFLSFHPGIPYFLPHFGGQSKRQYQQLLANETDRDARQMWKSYLRILSGRGLRDFTLDSTPGFQEVFSFSDLYFNSSMINSTFYKTQVPMDIWTEAFLHIVNSNPDLILNSDLSSTMSALIAYFKENYPVEYSSKKHLVDSALSTKGWSTITEADAKVSLGAFPQSHGKRAVAVRVLVDRLSIASNPDQFFIVELFGNKKPISNLSCRENAYCRNIGFILKKDPKCDISPCTCFDTDVSLSARFYFLNSLGKVQKSILPDANELKLESGCYSIQPDQVNGKPN